MQDDESNRQQNNDTLSLILAQIAYAQQQNINNRNNTNNSSQEQPGQNSNQFQSRPDLAMIRPRLNQTQSSHQQSLLLETLISAASAPRDYSNSNQPHGNNLRFDHYLRGYGQQQQQLPQHDREKQFQEHHERTSPSQSLVLLDYLLRNSLSSSNPTSNAGLHPDSSNIASIESALSAQRRPSSSDRGGITNSNVRSVETLEQQLQLHAQLQRCLDEQKAQQQYRSQLDILTTSLGNSSASTTNLPTAGTRTKPVHQHNERNRILEAINNALKILQSTSIESDDNIVQQWEGKLASTESSSYSCLDDDGRIISTTSPAILDPVSVASSLNVRANPYERGIPSSSANATSCNTNTSSRIRNPIDPRLDFASSITLPNVTSTMNSANTSLDADLIRLLQLAANATKQPPQPSYHPSK